MHKLIVFEGIDGVGKTTLSRMLVKSLHTKNIPAVRYEDIEDENSVFNKNKPLIANSFSKDVSLYFYLASAVAKSEIISKLLESTTVVCDRYVYSTLAYHYSVGVAEANLIHPEELPIRTPDYHFLLAPEETVRQERVTHKPDAEDEDFLIKSKGSFFDIFERKLKEFKPIVIDSSLQTPDQTLEQILGHMF